MKENTQEKNLIEKEKVGFFGRIKNFFTNIFNKKAKNEENNIEEVDKKENNEFKENLKTIENDETRLLELQERYRKGEIAEADLTEAQIDALCDLYDKQIEQLKKSIEIKEKKIAEYKKKNRQEKNA